MAVTSPATSNDNRNSSRRSTRSQNKKHNDGELNKKPGSQNKKHNDEELNRKPEEKPFLTPLAARAALASLKHQQEWPLKQELFMSHAEQEGHESFIQNNAKVRPLDVTDAQIKNGASSHDITPDHKNPIHDGADDMHKKSRGTPRHSDKKAMQRSSKIEVAPHVEKLPNRLTRSSVIKKAEVLSDEVKEDPSREKLASPATSTRKTLLSVHKEIEASIDEANHVFSVDNLISPVNATRKTRSSVHKEIEASIDEANHVFSVDNLTSPVKATAATCSRTQKQLSNLGVVQKSREYNPMQDTTGKFEESDGKQGSSRSTTTRMTRFAAQKGSEAPTVEAKQRSSSQRLGSSIGRMTRSRNQKEKDNADIDQELGETDQSEDVAADKSNGKKRPLTESSNECSKRTKSSPPPAFATGDSGNSCSSQSFLHLYNYIVHTRDIR